ncbi:spore protease YyaC [Paenibacillus septentrionalis]|uniref:Spore protease YyaC n=1 Tax=Paenibacillus septentrionalis TaxID=429342 RepID=A0ABW1V6H2_9BACL
MDTNQPIKIPYNSPMIRSLLQQELTNLLQQALSHQQIVVICIGTDRSTGDSLGPLVGSSLTKYRSSFMHVYGTIADPVHALNLADTLTNIHKQHPDPFIIGIDACLGQATSVGCIQAGSGPVRPGAGVNKDLPAVGDIHVTGIVNVGGFMEYFVLQNTRLHLVMSMSEIISQCLYYAISKHYRNLNSSDHPHSTGVH